MARRIIVRKILGEGTVSGTEESGTETGAAAPARRALSDELIEHWARILMAAFEADPHRYGEGKKGLGLAICALAGASVAATVLIEIFSRQLGG